MMCTFSKQCLCYYMFIKGNEYVRVFNEYLKFEELN